MSTYKLMKRVIERAKKDGTLDVEDTMDKLDAFLATGRITRAQYEELVALVEEN